MKVAFLVNDLQLSGGIGVVVQHARRLSKLPGWDVTLVLVREEEDPSWEGYDHLAHLHVRSRPEALGETYDIAVATWWETTFTLFELSAQRYVYFVQSLEDRFYHYDQASRLGAGLTLDLPVSFITEARWIADTLAGLRPDAACYLVRNGIDRETFKPLERVLPAVGDPLRILIEGSPDVWFKGVGEAIQATEQMSQACRVTVVSGDGAGLDQVNADERLSRLNHRQMGELYERTDVVLKLSSVEGMFGPPLEGFHRGATCAVTPVTGHDEFVEHGFNGLLTDWNDTLGTARQLDLLAADRKLLHYLRTNALETARAWPSWDQSSQFMAAALLAIMREPPPGGSAAAARLLADLRGGLESYEARLRERRDFAQRALRYEGRIDRVRRNRWVIRAQALRRRRAARLAVRPLRPLFRRIRQLLS